MKPVWTWGGIFFGYLEGENLWTHEGRHVGKLRRDVVYGADGRYLGELKNGNRLIARVGAHGESIPGFVPYTSRPPTTRYDNDGAYPMPADHTDFAPPESFFSR
jgi:hypothetical protein